MQFLIGAVGLILAFQAFVKQFVGRNSGAKS